MDETAAEVRRLRLTIVAIALVVVLVAGGWLLYRRASDDGSRRADDKLACVSDNLSSPTTRDC